MQLMVPLVPQFAEAMQEDFPATEFFAASADGGAARLARKV
jgi:hypothetical protein